MMDDFNFKAEVLQRLATLETILKNQDYKVVQEKADKALDQAKKNEDDIKEIKDKNKWYYRIIVAAFLAAFVDIIISFFKSGIGIN